jgi:predicted phosphodiesterase
MHNSRYRLTPEEYEIIADIRSARLKEAQRAGGITRGKQIAETFEQGNYDGQVPKQKRRVPANSRRKPHVLTQEDRQKGGKKTASVLAEANYNIKGFEAIAAEIERRNPTGAIVEEEIIPDGALRDDNICEVTSSLTGIISDMHWPFHDLKRLADGKYYGSYITALEHLAELGIKTLIINGDAMDCYQLSRHEKIEKQRDFKWELDVARAMLSHIRRLFGDKVRIIYREGNHEERFAKYLAGKADAFQGVISLDSLLRLSEFGIEWVGEKRKLSIGKLWVDHGHEWFGSGGVNPARAYRMKANDNILLGHVHRTTFDMVKRPLDGSFFAGWTMGCLCDLNPYYAPRNAWNHGVCSVLLDGTGEFTINNRIILNGKVR